MQDKLNLNLKASLRKCLLFLFFCVSINLLGCERANQKAEISPEITLAVIATEPTSPTVLGLGEKLVVIIHCEPPTSQPVQVWTRPYRNGNPVQGYRAHRLETISKEDNPEEIVTGWFNFENPKVIDEVRVFMRDSSSKEIIATHSYKVDVKWVDEDIEKVGTKNSSDNSGHTHSMDAALSGPALEIVEKEIDLGDIPAAETEIVGQILLYNPGSKPLRITKVTGPCSCFIGSAGDNLIQPGDAGELVIRFDKNKIEAGPARKLANIYTNDPDNELTKVYFNFTIERDPLTEQLRALRVELAGIKHEIHLLRSETKKTPRERTVKNRPSDTTVYKINMGESPVLGAKDVAVTIVEFGDFQCPYSVREYPKIQKILQEYPGKVRYVFKHYPLGFHKKARPVHAATELARLEGGNEAFWKMHDMIMAAPRKLEISDLRKYAQTLNLDLAQFDEVMDDTQKINNLLIADTEEAKRCKVQATPTVLINGLKMTNRSLEGYKARIDQILAQKNL